MSIILNTLTWLALSAALNASPVSSPAPYGPLPSVRQLQWHDMEYYGFIHFTTNTFTDKEWGYGDESPPIFNPTTLDTRQWARVARNAGMKGLIITAKHHDGFCLWPSAYTEHSVKHSPWKNGQGDVLRELREACDEYGLHMGVYLSPWDRHHPEYGSPAYLTYYRHQLRELLTQYGDLFEVWFDGANGGTGFYGGAREERHIDNRTYYDWPTTWSIVRELQPQAVMFSDAGPDVRWVGNEHGLGSETNWATLERDRFYPGTPDYQELPQGHRHGTYWVPAEVDVSIRPGWFYHTAEGSQVKTVEDLLEIYYHSVGMGCNLLLNLPPDRRGLIHETDVTRLMELRDILDQTFATDLAQGKTITATHVRGNSDTFNSDLLTDGDRNTYWATDDHVHTASLTLDLGNPTAFNRIRLQEHIALGQRIEAFTLEARVNQTWQPITEGTTIGPRRILCFDTVTASQIRLNITQCPVCPTLSTFEVYRAPNFTSAK